MKYNNITGSINRVSLAIYDDLIQSYVEEVKQIQGVKSIIQIGSFTAPGLSDIDIIVIVDDENPPKWQEISIIKILKDKEGYEVIAHDVFVYPESLADYIEGLFYLDRKKVLFGNDIGGKLSEKKIDKLKLVLTFEYTIHRLETLVVLTSLPSVNIRDILLFISTLRHTYKLLHDFNIISINERDKRVNQIEELRTLSIDNGKEEFREKLNEWIIPSFKAIYESAILIGEKLNYKNSDHIKKWILNDNKLIFNVDSAKEATDFFISNNKLNSLIKAKALIEPMPSSVYSHVLNYKQIGDKNEFNFDNIDIPSLRYYLAKEHSKFINNNNYPIAKSYIILSNEPRRIQARVKRVFLIFYSFFR